MESREISTRQRFNRVWDSVTGDGQESFQVMTASIDESSPQTLAVNAHQEPYVQGSFRSRNRRLEVMRGNTRVACLTEGQATFLPKNEFVLKVLSAIERVLPPIK